MGQRLEGKTCIVTGGANGIGRAIAELFVAHGASVVVTDLDVKAGRILATALGDRSIFVEHDVRVEEAWRSLVAMATQRSGRLDVLVNNAAISRNAGIEEETLDHWRAIQAVNVEGVFLGCKHAIPAMRASGGGSIVNVTSTVVHQPLAFNPAYAASKGATDALTRAVAIYCLERGEPIRCNAIEPHATDTPRLRQILESLESGRTTGRASGTRMKLGSTQSVANAALFLASDESIEITGSALNLDRGARLVLADGPI